MRLLIFGHSYVRSFARTNTFNLQYGDITVNIKYSYYPGVNYRKVLENPQILADTILTYNPDFLICVIGGNSISNSISSAELCRECRRFYEFVRSLSSKLIIIPAQVELRFYALGNRYNSPTPRQYKQKRDALNKFINKLQIKDHILMVGGPSRLDHRVFYSSDGVHLNKYGVQKYMKYIKNTIDFALSSHQLN